MSHEITVRKDGTAEMFAAGSTPVWHRLGQRTERAVTSGAALKLAGLDWQVAERQICVQSDREMKLVASHKAIVRMDSGDVVGVVGRKYKPVQNEEAFQWLDELVGCRLAIYETAGSLRNGSLVWALVRLPGELRIKGTDDVTRPYILLCNSHDGSIAFRAMNCAVRVVCSNTITMALRGAGTDSISVRHTERIHDRIADAQRVLGVAVDQHRVFEMQMNALARTKLKPRQFSRYLTNVLGPVQKDNDGMQRVRAHVVANFDHPLQRLRGIEGSAWAAYNSVSQWIDWERMTRGTSQRERDERRFASTLVGAGAELKRKAFNEALAIAEAAA
jgi:phage/plasmid-like protein (TIGR03299 family)